MRAKLTRLPGDRYIFSFDTDVPTELMEQIKEAWSEWFSKTGGIGRPFIMSCPVDYEDHSNTLEARIEKLEEMLS